MLDIVSVYYVLNMNLASSMQFSMNVGPVHLSMAPVLLETTNGFVIVLLDLNTMKTRLMETDVRKVKSQTM